MRIVPFIITSAITVSMCVGLSKKWGSLPPLGSFMSPQHGFWKNAEAVDKNFSADLEFTNLKDNATVYLDNNLVPHVFAKNDEDVYFIQGYLHARFRLFQMDLQTLAAAGRASEIAGEKAIEFDKGQRRLGMVYAATNAVKEMESNPQQKLIYEAYAKGVNTYIQSLKPADFPLEYKILDCKPNEWSVLRTALLLKMMAKNLSSGTEDDFNYTNARTVFSVNELKTLYPQVADSLKPIIPAGTAFPKPGIVPIKPQVADSFYFKDKIDTVEKDKPNPNNGSNNWAVAGSKTKSGKPVLCNDPHLELSLPSIWYEMQISTGTSNAYGVSLPGSPFIVIGFNDSIAWGVTNAQRDVKDYYDITFKDNSKKEYRYNGDWIPTQLSYEEIKVNGSHTVYDTVAYTIYGPVMYDKAFDSKIKTYPSLAVRWTAHDPSNEGYTFYKLNRAHNYNEYVDAIKTFVCPGQNFVFASTTGDIAIWQQGKFPARWWGQGLAVMPGFDSTFAWQGFIPQQENPHILNPPLGFIESCNQRPVDSTYPYFIPGSYITARGITATHKLASMSNITVQDMMAMQNNYFNTTAQDFVPLLIKHSNENELNSTEKNYFGVLKSWNLEASPDSKGQTIYQAWVDSLRKDIWQDECTVNGLNLNMPGMQSTLELLIRDSASKYIDNRNTPHVEKIGEVFTTSFKKAAIALAKLDAENKLEWSKFKNPTVYHLLKEPLKAFARTGLHVGGNGDILNAVTHSHGPSWRMIVELTTPVQAYGIYPAGQDGNPGSKYYDNYVDKWVRGEYNTLWFMKESESNDSRIKSVIQFKKA